VFRGMFNAHSARTLSFKGTTSLGIKVFEEVYSEVSILSKIKEFITGETCRKRLTLEKITNVFYDSDGGNEISRLHRLSTDANDIKRTRLGEFSEEHMTFHETFRTVARRMSEGDYYAEKLNNLINSEENFAKVKSGHIIDMDEVTDEETLFDTIDKSEIVDGTLNLIVNEIDGVNSSWNIFTYAEVEDTEIDWKLRTYDLPAIVMQIVKTNGDKYDFYYLGVLWNMIRTECDSDLEDGMAYVRVLNDKSAPAFSLRTNMISETLSRATATSSFRFLKVSILSSFKVKNPVQVDVSFDIRAKEMYAKAVEGNKTLSLAVFIMLIKTNSVLVFGADQTTYIKMVDDNYSTIEGGLYSAELEAYNIFISDRKEAVVRHAGRVNIKFGSVSAKEVIGLWSDTKVLFNVRKSEKKPERDYRGV